MRQTCRRHDIVRNPASSVRGKELTEKLASRQDASCEYFLYFCIIMSKVKALYHIVFCTKGRRMTIPPEYKEELYRFLWRKIQDNNCKLLRVGGIQNHVHLLIDLHPSVALANLVKVLKGTSSSWMKSDPRFRLFEGWAADYYGCTVSPEASTPVCEYIKNQELHHNSRDTDDEITGLYRYADLRYDERDLR